MKNLLAQIREAKATITANETFEGAHNGIVKETEKAVLASFANSKQQEKNVWIPKSLVSKITDNTIEVASWFYAKELSWTIA